MISKMDFNVSLAYVPKEQMELAVFLMTLCLDEELMASPPQFYSHRFVLQWYGHCPHDSGHLVYYKAVDDEVWIWDAEYQEDLFSDEEEILDRLEKVEPYVKVVRNNEVAELPRYLGVIEFLRGDL